MFDLMEIAAVAVAVATAAAGKIGRVEKNDACGSALRMRSAWRNGKGQWMCDGRWWVMRVQDGKYLVRRALHEMVQGCRES